MSYNIKVLYKIKKRKRGNFMKKKGLAISAVAASLAAAAVFAGGDCQTVRAADVADGTSIDLGLEGDYVEKQLSTADTKAIINQMGYGFYEGNVVVCGKNTQAYIDWEKSSIPYWKAYSSEVIVPSVSRDTDGNLVIEKDTDGELKTKYVGGLVWNGSKYRPAVEPDMYIKGFNVLPKENWNASDWWSHNHLNCLNENMGSTEIGGADLDEYKNDRIDDAYIIRVYYTADDLGNLTMAGGLDVYGENNTDTYGDSLSGDEWSKYYTLENRTCSYVDFWILPEGVSTVLNFEDETPAPSPSEDNYTVDLGDSQIVSADTFASILAENATKDVIIKSNNNVTFTFAKGTMSSVDGKTEYDFSTSVNSAYAATMPSYITKDNFVSQINFNYSGKLPATANIRFYAGTEYAGQTLYYSLMNADNTFAEVQAVVVDADGYMTVKQDHCSSYVVTKTEPKLPSNNDTKTDDGNTSNNGGSSNNGNASASDNNTSSGNTTVSTDKNASSANTTATSPKTGDMTPIAIYIVMAVVAMGVIVFVKRRKTA